MSWLDKLVRSKGYKNFMSKLYGWGAAIVIVGALFKINHWPGGTEMLIIGMGTETVIFILSAFEPQHIEWNWSLVFPQLAGMADGHSAIEEGEKKEESQEGGAVQTTASGENQSAGNQAAVAHSNAPSNKLDQMLEDANITPELIERLGKGMETLAETASKMNEVASVANTTNQFVSNMSGAAEAASRLQQSMKEAPDAVITLTNIYKETAQAMTSTDSNYAEEMKKMSASLASINAMYELQLKNSTNQLASTKEVEERMQTMVNDFIETTEAVSTYKTQVNALSRKVSELNEVYGKMLAAMQTRI